MESLNLKIENWEAKEVEEISYSVSLKVPPKAELLRLIPTHLSNLDYCLRFQTGILSQFEHSIKVCLYREYHEPKIAVYVKINNSKPDQVIEVRGVDITYVSEPQSTSSPVEDNMIRIENPLKPLEVLGAEFWQCICGWPDHSCILFLLFHVFKRKSPRITREDPDQLVPPGSFLNLQGLMNIQSYFLSDECSDVTIQCGSTKFPAHRLILSNKSQYFSSMFSSSMKESREGVIQINDTSPSTIKELLRFIYQGMIEHPDSCAKELFIAAEKYGMADLKALCERHLLEKLAVENALDIYDLSQLHGSPLLLKKAKEIIIWNKGKFAPDAETFKNFTIKYPELMFELFKFQS